MADLDWPQDRLGLGRPDSWVQYHISIGDVDVSRARVSGQVSSRVGDLARAELILDKADPSIGLVDYAGKTVVSIQQGDVLKPRFTGSVVRASVDGEALHVHAASSPDLLDKKIGGLDISGASALDAIYMLVRTAGLPESGVHIEGLDKLPYEMFEVVVPVDGMAPGSPTRVGSVALVPGAGQQIASSYKTETELLRRFVGATSYAVAYVNARTMYQAELRGIAAIDTTLSWLTVRSRYTFAMLPDGRLVDWSRDSLSLRPARRDCVSVRGLRSQRSWIRSVVDPPVEGALSVGEMSHPPLDPRLSTTRRQALVAASRAVLSDDPIDKITSMWEALEHYVADTVVADLFTKAELKSIRRAIPGTIDGDKKRRVDDLIGLLNQAPLLARLRQRLVEDGVPITASEFDLLRTLRQARNDVVHGRVKEPPEIDAVVRGTSVLARILVYSMHRTTGRVSMQSPSVNP